MPADKRLQPPKDLDGYFPFTPPKSPEQWHPRREALQRQILVSQGLWPMPTKTPLNAVVHGRVERDDYTVEKAYFESMPGFYVTGSLYRPKGKSGKLPGVLCPHGHWADGRFHDAGLDEVRKEIARGAEQFEEGGRSPLQARCVQLARMGCVVFHYDMIGYADSVQISFDLAHRFAKQRAGDEHGRELGPVQSAGGGASPIRDGLADLQLDPRAGLPASLPDVDPARIGVTGASGGGTQTFILCCDRSASDGRLSGRHGVDGHARRLHLRKRVVPAGRNGQCRDRRTFRPQAAGPDGGRTIGPRRWRRKAFPNCKQHYQMLGAPGNVMLKAALQFGHNYNYVSRTAMYGWFNKHLKLGLAEPIVERDYQRLTRDEMTVWDDSHPKPEGGAEFERKLCAGGRTMPIGSGLICAQGCGFIGRFPHKSRPGTGCRGRSRPSDWQAGLRPKFRRGMRPVPTSDWAAEKRIPGAGTAVVGAEASSGRREADCVVAPCGRQGRSAGCRRETAG